MNDDDTHVRSTPSSSTAMPTSAPSFPFPFKGGRETSGPLCHLEKVNATEKIRALEAKWHPLLSLRRERMKERDSLAAEHAQETIRTQSILPTEKAKKADDEKTVKRIRLVSKDFLEPFHHGFSSSSSLFLLLHESE